MSLLLLMLKRQIKTGLSLVLIILCSCNYRFVATDPGDREIGISIPYVKNDFEGLFTDALVREVSQTGIYVFRQGGSRYRLDVEVIEDIKDLIGFQYDRNDLTGKRNQNLEPSESRHTMTAVVSVVDTLSNRVIFGPVEITGNSEFDYVNPSSINELAFVDPECQCQTVLNFSLGQFDSIDSAQENSLVPLYQNLSAKIAQALTQIVF